jgi:hypothetical protein
MHCGTMNLPGPKLIVWLLIIALTASGLSARADCLVALQKCDEALQARERQVQICDLALRQSLERGMLANLEIRDKDAQLSAWYRNPFTVGTIGALVGLVVAGIAFKK